MTASVLDRAPAPAAAAPTSAPHEVVGFLVVGALTTAAYAALFAVAAPVVGAQVANTLALLLTADVNTRANRRWTFRVAAEHTTLRQRLQGSAAFALTWFGTSAALAVLAATGSISSTLQTAVLVLANAVAGGVHFLLLKRWAFRR